MNKLRASILRPTNISMLNLLIIAIIAAVLGYMLAYNMAPTNNVSAQLQRDQPQNNQRQLKLKLAESEALLALRDGQIDAMQQQLERDQHAMQTMQQRLAMFEDVLAARKIRGVHILHPSAQWQNQDIENRSIEYRLTLVKGENYPRKAKGSLRFSVIGPNGQQIALNIASGQPSLSFEMVTHAFFEGAIAWTKQWRPKQLSISLFDKRGKLSRQVDIPILNNQRSNTKHKGATP